jgi:type IV secretory pathway protease TraF
MTRSYGLSRMRPLPIWQSRQKLHRDEVSLLTKDVPSSFDRQYFGPMKRSATFGKPGSIWTR